MFVSLDGLVDLNEGKPTVDKFLLVFGSVTKKQYEPLRIQFLRKGVKVRIVRISDDYRSSSYFFFRLWEAHRGKNEIDFEDCDAVEAAERELIENFYLKEFGTSDLSTVVGAVLPVRTEEEDLHEISEWPLFIAELPSAAPVYRVTKCARIPNSYYLECRSHQGKPALDVKS